MRYNYTRYFAPLERNRPTSVDEIHRWNDVELYDLKSDPDEMKNLAPAKGVSDALVAAMNGKLNRMMDSEFGKDDGREMPDVAGIDWAIDRIDL
ncbi:MAG: hypothetical protein IT515_04455 [Burkholderiales bacterium]|nr:hypothetical protein [Burkholderiales bacterium]